MWYKRFLMLLADSAVQIILSINMQPNSVNSDQKKKKKIQSLQCLLVSWWNNRGGLFCMEFNKQHVAQLHPSFFFERPARWDFKNEGCIRYQQSITRFVETSPQSFPRVTLENRAQAITIHQPEIMRAHKVHSKDTATHSLSQDRHKGMLLPGKPSVCFLPRGCTVLNNAYLKT